MKNEVIQVYRNAEYEDKIKKDLQISRDAMQKILNAWLALNLGPCMGLNDLILRPRAVFDRAVNDIIKVPELPGPFKMDKTKYRDTLSIPDAFALFDACKKALQLPFCAMYGIFIVNDDLVEMDETEAGQLINSQSINVSTDEQKRLAEDILKYIELTNMLALKFPSDFLLQTPSANNFFGNGKFYITQKSFPGPYSLEIIPSKLREWLSK